MSWWYLEHRGYLSQKCRLCTSSTCAWGRGIYRLLLRLVQPTTHHQFQTSRGVSFFVCVCVFDFPDCLWGGWQKQREVTLSQVSCLVEIMEVIVKNGNMFMILCGLFSFSNWTETTSCWIRSHRCLFMSSLVLLIFVEKVWQDTRMAHFALWSLFFYLKHVNWFSVYTSRSFPVPYRQMWHIENLCLRVQSAMPVCETVAAWPLFPDKLALINLIHSDIRGNQEVLSFLFPTGHTRRVEVVVVGFIWPCVTFNKETSLCVEW